MLLMYVSRVQASVKAVSNTRAEKSPSATGVIPKSLRISLSSSGASPTLKTFPVVNIKTALKI